MMFWKEKWRFALRARNMKLNKEYIKDTFNNCLPFSIRYIDVALTDRRNNGPFHIIDKDVVNAYMAIELYQPIVSRDGKV